MRDSIANGYLQCRAPTIIVNTGNINVSNTLTLTGTLGVTSLRVAGNIYASNALTTTNVFTVTETVTGTPGMTSLNVTGNLYVSNALTTTNVYATRVYGDGGFLSNVTSTPTNNVRKITANHTVLLTDYYIGVNGTGVTVTLPLGSTVPSGKTYVIKDESGLVTPNSAYRFTIQRSGSDLIDASTSITVTVSFISLTFLWNGSSWSII
jgi:hypothetical protein